jgi:hypothetical protein
MFSIRLQRRIERGRTKRVRLPIPHFPQTNLILSRCLGTFLGCPCQPYSAPQPAPPQSDGNLDFWIAYGLEYEQTCSLVECSAATYTPRIFLKNGPATPACADFPFEIDVAYSIDLNGNWPAKFTSELCGTVVDFYNQNDGQNSLKFYVAGGDGTLSKYAQHWMGVIC